MHFVALDTLEFAREKPPTGYLRLTRAIVDTVIDTRIRLLPMKIHQLSAADAIASLTVALKGFRPTKPSAGSSSTGAIGWKKSFANRCSYRFLKEFTHFFALILWLAAALAFLAEWVDPGQGMAKIGYAVVAVIIVSGVVLLLAGVSGRTNTCRFAPTAAATGRGIARRQGVAAIGGATGAGRHRRAGARQQHSGRLPSDRGI